MIYLDTETTGLNCYRDEILEIAIIDANGKKLLDSLVKPVKKVTWQDAQAIHGITPDMVKNAPTLKALENEIKEIVQDQEVVIYNADFDTSFLKNLLDDVKAVHCCMVQYAEHIGDYSEYWEGNRWHKLSEAAYYVMYEWEGTTHRALADCFACRAVWEYLHSEEKQQKVQAIKDDKEAAWQAEIYLDDIEYEERRNRQVKNEQIQSFIFSWWLKKPVLYSYWTDQYKLEWSTRYRCFRIENELCMVFFGLSIKSLNIQEQFDEKGIYRNRNKIPPHLWPISRFKQEDWVIAELEPCAAYVSKKQAWLLYDRKSELQRIKRQYPLRFAKIPENTILYTKSDLKKKGYTEKDIQCLTPISEYLHWKYGKWYPLYGIKEPEK